MSNAGHNSGDEFSTVQVAADQLRAIVERVERIDVERSELNEDRKEIFSEAKGNGFDVKTLKAIIKLRKMEPDQLAEQEAMLDLYKYAMGMS